MHIFQSFFFDQKMLGESFSLFNQFSYQKLTSEVHEIVGRINGRFRTLSVVPIHHLELGGRAGERAREGGRERESEGGWRERERARREGGRELGGRAGEREREGERERGRE